jgi:tetratricopeptide (TPR) repeat protein
MAVLTSCFLVVAAVPLAAQVSDGDAHWARRAEGARGSFAAAGQVDAAIGAYRVALEKNPWDLEARWKLLRALRFKGVYVAQTAAAKKAIFDEAKTIGGVGIEQLDRHLSSRRAGSISEGAIGPIVAALKPIPNAGELLYWDAANWGEWALVFGKVAAARQGVADRIRREASIVLTLDPHIENGGGARILGRLHHQTPRVPLITGWASNSEAVKFLEQSAAIDPHNKLTQLFLAEALADQKKKDRAAAILRSIVAARPDASVAVEDASAQDEARALLETWGRR